MCAPECIHVHASASSAGGRPEWARRPRPGPRPRHRSAPRFRPGERTAENRARTGRSALFRPTMAARPQSCGFAFRRTCCSGDRLGAVLGLAGQVVTIGVADRRERRGANEQRLVLTGSKPVLLALLIGASPSSSRAFEEVCAWAPRQMHTLHTLRPAGCPRAPTATAAASARRAVRPPLRRWPPPQPSHRG